jgi:hypothetical protein
LSVQVVNLVNWAPPVFSPEEVADGFASRFGGLDTQRQRQGTKAHPVFRAMK